MNMTFQLHPFPMRGIHTRMPGETWMVKVAGEGGKDAVRNTAGGISWLGLWLHLGQYRTNWRWEKISSATGHDPDSPWTGQSWSVWKARCLLGMAGHKQGEFVQKRLSAIVQGPLVQAAWPEKREEGGMLPCRAPHRSIKGDSKDSEP